MSDQPDHINRKFWEGCLDFFERKFKQDPFASAMGLILGLWVGTAVFSRWLPMEVAGTFGDTFGTMNSLIGGLTLLGVAYAASLQREELKLTKEELDNSEEERKKTLKLLGDQASAMRATAELNALNSLLDVYSKTFELAQENHNKFLNGSVHEKFRGTIREEDLESEVKSRKILLERHLQLVQMKFTELQVSNSTFNWGFLPENLRTDVMKYFIIKFRETRSRIYHDFPGLDRNDLKILQNKYLPLIDEMVLQITHLTSQDFIVGTKESKLLIKFWFIFIQLKNLFNANHTKTEAERVQTIWRYMDLAFDESKIPELCEITYGPNI